MSPNVKSTEQAGQHKSGAPKTLGLGFTQNNIIMEE
jgi:hypothetical protein